MTGAALRREIKTKYEKAEGVRFFSEKALLFALLDRNGLPKDYLIRTGSAEINEDLSRALLADAERLLAGEPLQYYLGYGGTGAGGGAFFAERGAFPRFLLWFGLCGRVSGANPSRSDRRFV